VGVHGVLREFEAVGDSYSFNRDLSGIRFWEVSAPGGTWLQKRIVNPPAATTGIRLILPIDVAAKSSIYRYDLSAD